MKRTSILAPLAVLLLVGAGCAPPFGSILREPPAKNAGPSAPQGTTPAPGAPAVNVPVSQEPAATPEGGEIAHGETAAAEPVPYFPPPSLDLTGSKLGTQRVPGAEAIGDVHQIFFHQPTGNLFMAVTEPDGVRSLWRLTQNGKTERVLIASSKEGEMAIFGDSQGNLFFQHDNPCGMVRSSDGFKTWHEVKNDRCMFWAMADDGNGTLYATLHDWNAAILYRSPDGGFSWEPWKDFQKLFPEYAVPYADGDGRFKLRHLHDVIYDDKSKLLIVGTGDVARFAYQSWDGGDTWKKVWDEGFTSHVAMSGGNRYLLGPDQLHNHGVALYDVWNGKLTEVFNPGKFGYAGYAYSMVDVDGVYYVALHTEANEVENIVPRSGIVASPDGTHWYKFIEWDPLTHHARTDIWLASAPATIYASVNGALYAFRPIDKTWFTFAPEFK